jgi:hypothetical protein
LVVNDTIKIIINKKSLRQEYGLYFITGKVISGYEMWFEELCNRFYPMNPQWLLDMEINIFEMPMFFA